MRVSTDMRHIFLAPLAILTCLSMLSAQENPTSANAPCIAPDAIVYLPGPGDGVKPPLPDSRAKGARLSLRSSVSLEVLLNSEGRVCNVRVLSANDKLSAEKARRDIFKNWRFKPATKDGKPVAVKLTINLSPSM